MLQTEIKNSDGSFVILNDHEARQVQLNQERANALGYEINITSLTAIAKRITDQKFYQIKPSDYVPVAVGEGAWSSEIVTYRQYEIGGDFETGIVNTASNDSRIAQMDTGIDSVTVPVTNWAKTVGWSVFELQQASKAGNWDIVTAKEMSRKKNWDLGIQKTAFVGLQSNPDVYGLLTQPDVNSNTGLITQYISAMNAAQFNTFLEGIIGAYQTNNAFTCMPTHFIIPQLDYNGLISFPDAAFPLKTKLEILQDNLRAITLNPNFMIRPLAYADEVNNVAVTGLNKNRYTLLNYDPTSLRMDIPVDYTNTMANTFNGMQFENTGYGQFTGARAYRPLEMLYFDFAT